jgi:hypothetical protein
MLLAGAAAESPLVPVLTVVTAAIGLGLLGFTAASSNRRNEATTTQ